MIIGISKRIYVGLAAVLAELFIKYQFANNAVVDNYCLFCLCRQFIADEW